MSGFQDIGFGMAGGSGSQAIGPCLPVRMPNGFLVIGSVSQLAGFGLRGIGDTDDVSLEKKNEKADTAKDPLEPGSVSG